MSIVDTISKEMYYFSSGIVTRLRRKPPTPVGGAPHGLMYKLVINFLKYTWEKVI
jgi:hypothetical protein